MTDAKLVKQLLDAFRKSQSKGTQGYDSQAVVKRVEGNTIWVHIPGGSDETPIRKTVSETKRLRQRTTRSRKRQIKRQGKQKRSLKRQRSKQETRPRCL